MRTIRVLFVGGAKRFSAAEELLQAGRDLGVRVEIVAYEMGFGLPIADIATVIQGRKFSDAGALRHLQDVLREYSIDIALPYHDGAIPLLAPLSPDVFVPTCSPELVQVFSSKIKSGIFFREQDIPQPGFSGRVPAIAKPDYGSASKGLLHFTEQHELNAFLATNERSSYEVQDMASGPEYSVDGYISLNSEFRHFAVRQRIETLGGEVVRSQTVSIPQIDIQCERVAAITGMRGAITIQFIFDSRHMDYRVMEINPRFGGGMLASLGAGVPWFHILLRDFLCLPQHPVCHKAGVLMVRSFREHFFVGQS